MRWKQRREKAREQTELINFLFVVLLTWRIKSGINEPILVLSLFLSFSMYVTNFLNSPAGKLMCWHPCVAKQLGLCGCLIFPEPLTITFYSYLYCLLSQKETTEQQWYNVHIFWPNTYYISIEVFIAYSRLSIKLMLQNIYILSPLNRATNVLGLDVECTLLTDTVGFERILSHS